MGTPSREPQEYSRHIPGIYLPGSLHAYHIPTTFLGFPVSGSHFTLFTSESRVWRESTAGIVVCMLCPSDHPLPAPHDRSPHGLVMATYLEYWVLWRFLS